MKRIYCFVILMIFPALVSAEVVTLKSGVVIEGKINERSADYIKIDSRGEDVTYFADEIASIEGDVAKDDAGVSQESAADELISEVLSVSGLKEQIAQYPGIVKQSVEKAGEGKNPEVYGLVSKVILENFSAETIYREVLNKVRERYNKNNLTLMRDFFKSPLASKIVAMELAAGGPEHIEELQSYARSLENNPPISARLEAVKRLSAAAKVSDMSVAVALELGFAVIKAINASDIVTPDKKQDQAGLDNIKNQMREQLVESVGGSAIVSLLYMYRSLPDEELEQYTVFYESPVGRWFVNILEQAYMEAFAVIAERTAESMVDVVKNARLIR